MMRIQYKYSGNTTNFLLSNLRAKKSVPSFKGACFCRRSTFNELWEAMRLFEPEMARLAVRQTKAELIEKLTRNIQDTQEVTGEHTFTANISDPLKNGFDL